MSTVREKARATFLEYMRTFNWENAFDEYEKEFKDVLKGDHNTDDLYMIQGEISDALFEALDEIKTIVWTPDMLTQGSHKLSTMMTLFVGAKLVKDRGDDCLPRFCVWDEETDTHPLFTDSVEETLAFIKDMA